MDTDSNRSGSLRHDGLWVAGGQLATVASGVAMTVLAANFLSSEGFAAINWLLSWVLYTTAVSRLGGLQASTMLVASEPGQARSVAFRLLCWTFGLSLLVATSWIVAIRDWVAGFVGEGQSYQDAFSIFPYWLPAAAALPVVGGLLRGLEQFRTAVLLGEYMRRGSMVVVIGWLLLVGETVALRPLLVVAAIVEWIALAFGLFALRGAISGERSGGENVEGSRSMFRRTIDFYPLSIVAVLVPQGAVWVVGFVSNDEAVSQLAVALRISLLFLVPFAIGSRVFSPRIARLVKTDSLADLHVELQRFSTATTFFVVVCSFATLLFGRTAIVFVFGEAFVGAWTAVLVLALGGMVNTATGLSMAVLSNSGQARLVSTSSLITGVGFTVLVLVLGARFGSTGAAVGASLTLAVQNIVMAAISTRRTGLWVGASPRLFLTRGPI